MAFTYSWLVSKRVLVGRIWGMQTLSELEESISILWEYLDEGEAPVHFIANLEGLDKAPVDLNELTRLFRFTQSPRVGWIIIVGLSARNLVIILSVLSKIMRVPFKSFDTMDSAVVFLKENDPTLVFFDENVASSS